MKKLLSLLIALATCSPTFAAITTFHTSGPIVVNPATAPDCQTSCQVFQLFASGINSGGTAECAQATLEVINNDATKPNGSGFINNNGCQGLNVNITNVIAGYSYTVKITATITGFSRIYTESISVPQFSDITVTNIITVNVPSPAFCFTGSLEMFPGNIGCRSIVNPITGGNGTPFLRYPSGLLVGASNNVNGRYVYNFVKPGPFEVVTLVKNNQGIITEFATPVPGGFLPDCPKITINQTTQVSAKGCNDGKIVATVFASVCIGHGEPNFGLSIVEITKVVNGQETGVPYVGSGNTITANNLSPGSYTLKYKTGTSPANVTCTDVKTVELVDPPCSAITLQNSSSITFPRGCPASGVFGITSADCFTHWSLTIGGETSISPKGQIISMAIPLSSGSLPNATVRYTIGNETCETPNLPILATFAPCEANIQAIETQPATGEFCPNGKARVTIQSDVCGGWSAAFFKNNIQVGNTLTAGSIASQTFLNMEGLLPGVYEVRVSYGPTDDICTATQTVTVSHSGGSNECGQLHLFEIFPQSKLGCHDAHTSGTVERMQCNPETQLFLSRTFNGQESVDEVTLFGNSFTIANLGPGNYKLTAEFAPSSENSCTVEKTFTVINPPCGQAIFTAQAPAQITFGCPSPIVMQLNTLDCTPTWISPESELMGAQGTYPVNQSVSLIMPPYNEIGGPKTKSVSAFYEIDSTTCKFTATISYLFKSCDGVSDFNITKLPSGPSCFDGEITASIASVTCVTEYQLQIYTFNGNDSTLVAHKNGTIPQPIVITGLKPENYQCFLIYGPEGQECVKRFGLGMGHLGIAKNANRDADGDGFGDDFQFSVFCDGAIPPGFVQNSQDCNDNDASIHPGSSELCDNKDNNCNGQTDEGCATNQAPTPIISSPSTNFVNPTPVTISTGQNRPSSILETTATDPIIYYTLDGTTPTPGSPLTKTYTGPILIDGDLNLKAKAFQDGLNPSLVVSNFYTVTNPAVVTKPVVTPNGGALDGSVTVSISTTTPDAQIFYTTNGNLPRFDVPNSFTKLYTGPFTLFGTTTVKAISTKPGSANSSPASVNFIVNNPAIVAAPTYSPAPGNYPSAQTITLSCATAGAQIYYALNGFVPRFDVPNGFTKTYTGPFLVSNSTTIRAVALKSGFQTSAVPVGIYTIGPARRAFEDGEDAFYFEEFGAENEQVDNRITLVPNPTSGKTLIRISGSEAGGNITILNMLGQVIVSTKANESNTEIDLSSQPSGMYLVRFQNNQMVHEQKLIKQ